MFDVVSFALGFAAGILGVLSAQELWARRDSIDWKGWLDAFKW